MRKIPPPAMVLFENSLLSNATQAYGLDMSSEHKELWKLVEASFKNCKKDDLAALISVDAYESLEWWGSETSPLDDDTIPVNHQKWLAYDKPASYELEPVSIITLGDVANVSYRYKIRRNKMAGRGRIMETWIKQHNKWRFMSSMTVYCGKLPLCDAFVWAPFKE